MLRDMRNKILDATLEVIAKEKISGTRMHLIAKEADMTQSNLHYYFPTKNDLLIALLNNIQEWFSKNRQNKVDLHAQTFQENLHAIFAEKKNVIENHKKLDYVQFDYWVQGTVNPEVRDTFQKTFDIWRHDIQTVIQKAHINETEESSSSKMLPYIMVSLLMGASMQYLIDEGNFDLDEYFNEAESMILKILNNKES